MSYIVDVNEALGEQVQAQLRRFRARCSGKYRLWYASSCLSAKARGLPVPHDTVESFVMPNLVDESGDPVDWYHWNDPQSAQVRAVERNLESASDPGRGRGAVTPYKLKILMKELLGLRLRLYESQEKDMGKLKILCLVGESGCGKTLASLHLKNFMGANTVCSFTTRPPRPTEVEGRDHHFIDIVPDRGDLLAYAHFGGHYYYALKAQVHGECTVYVVDEKGLANLKADWGGEYEIRSVLIKRDRELRRRVGVSPQRLRRDLARQMDESAFDCVVENNGTKKEFFRKIEKIYEDFKNS